MIELTLKQSLETITLLTVYPLLLPDDVLEGITYQCISDPFIQTGLQRLALVEARYQITIQLLNDYSRLKQLDKLIWSHWRQGKQAFSDSSGIRYIERANIRENRETLADKQFLYQLSRDYLITYEEHHNESDN